MIKFIGTITRESIIDVEAKVTVPDQEIQSCTQKVELHVQKVFIVSKAHPELPFQLEDAQRKMDQNDFLDLGDQDVVQESKEGDENKVVKVGMKTRLDNRVIDMRTPQK